MTGVVLSKQGARKAEDNHRDRAMKSKRVEILYTNYKGERAWRRILPVKIWFGSTKWHPTTQWFVDAEDLDRNAVRSFALSDIALWRPEVGIESDDSAPPDH